MDSEWMRVHLVGHGRSLPPTGIDGEKSKVSVFVVRWPIFKTWRTDIFKKSLFLLGYRVCGHKSRLQHQQATTAQHQENYLQNNILSTCDHKQISKVNLSQAEYKHSRCKPNNLVQHAVHFIGKICVHMASYVNCIWRSFSLKEKENILGIGMNTENDHYYY